MHMHRSMMLICVGLVFLAVVLVAAGAGSLVLLAPLGCVLMMGAMAWMMLRPGGHGGHGGH